MEIRFQLRGAVDLDEHLTVTVRVALTSGMEHHGI
jgi:hypothetical protein